MAAVLATEIMTIAANVVMRMAVVCAVFFVHLAESAWCKLRPSTHVLQASQQGPRDNSQAVALALPCNRKARREASSVPAKDPRGRR
eukprot:scaffold92490_cov16-Prasinocladus_malaysianus.AAC.2